MKKNGREIANNREKKNSTQYTIIIFKKSKKLDFDETHFSQDKLVIINHNFVIQNNNGL